MGVMDARRRILLNAPHIATPASAGLVSFSTDMIAPLKECKVHFSPVQSGTGDPSPTNNRPISGWNQAGVHSMRQNLYTGSDISGTQYVEATVSAIPAGTYTFSAVVVTTDTDATSSLVYFYNSGGEIVGFASLLRSKGGARTWTDITLTDVCTKIGFYASNGWSGGEGDTFSYSNIWLDTGANASAVFPSTIYGGYVDLAAGEVVEEIHSYTFTGLETISNFSTSLNAAMYSPNNLDGAAWTSKSGGVAQACNYAVSASRITIGNYSNAFVVGDTTGSNQNILFLKIDGITSGSAMKAWLKEKADGGNPLVAVYPLATPITYTIDPATLRTLRGVNNIWANTNGTIDLSYWTH